MDCLFCKVAEHEIVSDIIFENDHIIAFKDVNPQAPVHHLIIPRKHIATINDIEEEDSLLLGNMVATARNIAQELSIADSGYRLVFNVNQDAGQAVFHIHLHLLGGRALSWPPG